jgi:hypothetical protein
MGRLGCLAVISLLVACKGKGNDKDAKTPTVDLVKRCQQLAKACGDSEKHVSKIDSECTAAIKPGCEAKAIAAYTCYEKELCGKGDKLWALGDFGVLAERHSKCVTERNALADCAPK